MTPQEERATEDRRLRAVPVDLEGLPDLVKRAVNNVIEIAELHLALVQAELRENLQKVIRAVGIMGAGGSLIYTGVIFLLLLGIVGLREWFEIPLWVSTLSLTLFLFIVGTILLIVGRSQIPKQPMALTRLAVEEGVQWIKAQQTNLGIDDPRAKSGTTSAPASPTPPPSSPNSATG